MRVLIVNIDPFTIKMLRQFCKGLKQPVEIAGIARDGNEAIKLLHRTVADIIFIDVDMYMVKGIELVRLVAEKNIHAIYLASRTSFAIRALREEGCPILLKPLQREHFMEVLQRTKKKLSPKPFFCEDGRIYVRVNRENYSFDINEIISIRGNANYSTFHIKGFPRKLMVCANLGSIQRVLPPSFYRSHNSYIINLDHLLRIVEGERTNLLMRNQSLAPVSRRNKFALLQKIGEREQTSGTEIPGVDS